MKNLTFIIVFVLMSIQVIPASATNLLGGIFDQIIKTLDTLGEAIDDDKLYKKDIPVFVSWVKPYNGTIIRKTKIKGGESSINCQMILKGGQINKKLNRLIKREVIDDPSVVLHSLRHSFKTLFRATSNDYELGEFILGHQGAGNTSSTYGESHALPQKKETMVRMDFSFLNTRRLTDERKTTGELK
jgi:integrase